MIGDRCDDYHIMWHFSADFDSIINEFSSDAAINSPSCTRTSSGGQNFLSKFSNLTITGIQSHHYGYYWCSMNVLSNNFLNKPQTLPVYSKMGLIRNASICEQVQPVAQCDEPVIELFQSADRDTCASTKSPNQPTLDPITHTCPLNMVSETITPDLNVSSLIYSTQASSIYLTPEASSIYPTPESTEDSVAVESKEEDMQHIFIFFAIALLLIFAVITAALLVVMAICYKKRASSTGWLQYTNSW